MGAQVYPSPRSQFPYCPEIFENDSLIGNYDNFSTDGMLPALYIEDSHQSYESIMVIRSRPICLTMGEYRGAFTTAAIIVDYIEEDNADVVLGALLVFICQIDTHNPNVENSWFPAFQASSNFLDRNTVRHTRGSVFHRNYTTDFSVQRQVTNCGECFEGNFNPSIWNRTSKCGGK